MKSNNKVLLVAGLAAVAMVAMPVVAAAQGVLFVKNNKVGIGVDPPTELLHVKSTAGGSNTLALVENTVGNGRVGSRFKNPVSSWDFRTDGLGDFIFDESSSAGQEVKIRKNGTVIMGPGGTNKFNLSPTGNLTITGTLTEGSSRAIKEGFTVMEPSRVLAQVANLEVLGWSYKNQSTRHIGPMAEDFYAAFELGPADNVVAPRDVAGVALLAVQGLHNEVQEKNSQIQQLQSQIDELRSVVEQLSSR